MLQKGLLFCMVFPALASLAMARLDAELFFGHFIFCLSLLWYWEG